jgi:hypothetical protein
LLEFSYAGIPVELDYANPEKLSVGYMVEWTWSTMRWQYED